MRQSTSALYSISIEEHLKPELLLCGKPNDGITNTYLVKELKKDYRVTCIYSEDRLFEYLLRHWTCDNGLGIAAILMCETVGLQRGCDLIRSLSRMGETCQTPVLVLSADESDLGSDVWLGAGAKGIALK